MGIHLLLHASLLISQAALPLALPLQLAVVPAAAAGLALPQPAHALASRDDVHRAAPLPLGAGKVLFVTKAVGVPTFRTAICEFNFGPAHAPAEQQQLQILPDGVEAAFGVEASLLLRTGRGPDKRGRHPAAEAKEKLTYVTNFNSIENASRGLTVVYDPLANTTKLLDTSACLDIFEDHGGCVSKIQ